MKRAELALATALALAAGCPPAARPPASPPAAVATAPVGRVIARPSDAKVIELRVAFEAGAADDPPGQQGLTYVTALSMLEGRAGQVGYAERAARLFPMAASIGVHVDREQVVFSGRVHVDHLAAFYPLFRDVLRAPAFDSADVDRVRTRALSNLTQDLRGADDEALGKEVLQAMLFEGHPYAHPELGTERGLSGFGPEQVRAQWRRVLCAGRVRIGVAGALASELSRRLEADLAGEPGESGCEDARPLPPPSSLATRRVWIVDKPEAGSVAISLGHSVDVTRDHPDFAALALASAYLGQHRTFAGRLMQAMRGERGLNYGDYAYAEHFVQDGASRFPLPNVARRQQYFSVWIRPVRPEHAHFALRFAVRELEKVASEGIGQADFERIQRFAASYFALFAQTEQQRLGYALDDGFYGVRAPHLDALRARFATLTRDEVNAALRRHVVPGRLQVAMVAKDASALAERLVKGDASPITYDTEKPQALRDEDTQVAAHPLGLSREQVNVVPLASMFR
ncbi:MAG: insulinase family protein [Polyangiales bacterium]